jgi:hypothetical protein
MESDAEPTAQDLCVSMNMAIAALECKKMKMDKYGFMNFAFGVWQELFESSHYKTFEEIETRIEDSIDKLEGILERKGRHEIY